MVLTNTESIGKLKNTMITQHDNSYLIDFYIFFTVLSSTIFVSMTQKLGHLNLSVQDKSWPTP